jgi:hypothetical protein
VASSGSGVADPLARRPAFPASYGIHSERDGLLDWSWAREWLESAHNYWVCTTRADGAPHARPVWAVWLSERLCFSTDPGSVKGRSLSRDPRLTVHLESGDQVVILEGVAESLPAGIADALADAYERKYDWKVTVSGSGWYAVRPLRAYAWTETDFPVTATRFDF